MLTSTDLTIEEARQKLYDEGYAPDEEGMWVPENGPYLGSDSVAIIARLGTGEKYTIIWTTREGINY